MGVFGVPLLYAGFVGFGVSATGFTVQVEGGLWYVGRLAGPCVILIFFIAPLPCWLLFYIYIWLLHSWVDMLVEGKSRKFGFVWLTGWRRQRVFTREGIY